MRSAVTKPIQRVTQQRVTHDPVMQHPVMQQHVVPPSAKPVISQPPANHTAAPVYHRPIRRLSDLPMGRRGGYSKPYTQDDRPSIEELEGQAEEESPRRRGYEDDEDDLSDLERDDEDDEDDEESDEEDPLTTLDLEARDIREIEPTIAYALQGIRGRELPERLSKPSAEPYVRPERTPIEFHWMASNLHHNPLYFEDPALERYGHAYHPLIQPFASAGRMTGQLLGLPYQMAIDPIHRRRYSLGWIRPGDCAPKLKYRIPFNKKAALVEAAAIATGAAILP